jgi:glutaredoxin
MSIPAQMGFFLPTVGHQAPATTPVTVYATWWNVGGHRVRRALNREGIAHHYVDVEMNPAAQSTLRNLATSDTLELPVVYIDGAWLTVPTLDEVESALRRHGLIRELEHWMPAPFESSWKQTHRV